MQMKNGKSQGGKSREERYLADAKSHFGHYQAEFKRRAKKVDEAFEKVVAAKTVDGLQAEVRYLSLAADDAHTLIANLPGYQPRVKTGRD